MEGIRSTCYLKGHIWGECTCKTEVANDKGFEHQGTWIVDPYISECGRFFVDPVIYYGDDYKAWLLKVGVYEQFKANN